MLSFQDFLAWEESTRDTIDFKKIYVDMAGDILAGLVLSEIIYWHMPSKNGKSRLSVHRDGEEWIACHRVEWWDRTRMTPRQIDRVFKILLVAGLIFKDRFHFAGKPTVHVRLNKEKFLSCWQELIKNPPVNPYKSNSPNGEIEETPIHQTVKTNSPNGENQFTASVNSYTETTAKTTNTTKRVVKHTTGKTPRTTTPRYIAKALQHEPMITWLVKKFRPEINVEMVGVRGLFKDMAEQYTKVCEAIVDAGLGLDDLPGEHAYLMGKGWPTFGVGKMGEYAHDYAGHKAKQNGAAHPKQDEKAELHSSLMLGGGAVA
jgi:hypothetical protein